MPFSALVLFLSALTITVSGLLPEVRKISPNMVYIGMCLGLVEGMVAAALIVVEHLPK